MERYEHELRKLIDAQIERLKDFLAAGSPEDMSEYRLMVGQITGLRQCIDLMDEARQKANQAR